MTQAPPPDSVALEYRSFVLLLIAVSLAFGWILLPFFGAVFWGMVLAIVFAPLNRRLLRASAQAREPGRAGDLVIILVLVTPAAGADHVAIAAGRHRGLRPDPVGRAGLGAWFRQISPRCRRLGRGPAGPVRADNIETCSARLYRLASPGSAVIAPGARHRPEHVRLRGQPSSSCSTCSFFLLRDGASLSRRIRSAVPLTPDPQRTCSTKFATVIRATVRATSWWQLVAGRARRLAFWYLGVHGAVLWAVLMAFLSLLPAIGAAVVWAAGRDLPPR